MVMDASKCLVRGASLANIEGNQRCGERNPRIPSFLAWAVFSATVVLAVSPLAVLADVYTILPDKAGEWSKGTSYSEGSAPGQGDVVKVAKATSVAANAADFEFLGTSGVASIAFEDLSGYAMPTLTVTIAANEDVTFGRRITNCVANTGKALTGTVVKNGPGTLRFTQGNIYGLQVSFEINDGLLQFPSGMTPASSSAHNAQYNRITVNAPGVLWPTTGETNGNYGLVNTYVLHGLWGDGVVSNPVSKLATLVCNAPASYNATFSGRIDGNTRIQVIKDDGIQTFTGMSSFNTTTSAHQIKRNSVLRLRSIGGTYGGTNDSAIGKSTIRLYETAKVEYVGEGGVSYGRIAAADGEDVPRLALGGGPNGGLDYRGLVSFSDTTSINTSLVLEGDHTNACRFAGTVTVKSETTRTNSLVKSGSGTWSLPYTGNAFFNGPVTVEDGSLEFDTLAGALKPCSLGLASALGDSAAVVLGTASTTGTLAYVGASAASTAMRSVALAGDGRIATSSGELAWGGGVSAASAGVHTLFVGGEGDGSVDGVHDGAGKVKVVKEGAGDWILRGALDFTGGIDVRGGSLAISNAAYSANYTYYRFMMRGSRGMVDDQGVYTTSPSVDTARLGLFDADGYWQNAGLTVNHDADGAAYKLAPGEFAPFSFNPSFDYSTAEAPSASSYYYMRSMFIAGSASSRDSIHRYKGKDSSKYVTRANTNSWVGVVFRLADGAHPVTSYDAGTRWAKAIDNSSKATINSWQIEGSLDGYSWTMLDERDDVAQAGGAYTWIYGGSPYYSNTYTNKDTYTYKKGIAIAPRANFPETLTGGLDEVSVATGASLVAAARVTVQKIAIDAAGMGTIDGFALAEGGVIDLVNAPPNGSFSVPADLSGVTLPSSYSITVNGKATRRRISVSNGEIRVVAPGMVLLVW